MLRVDLAETESSNPNHPAIKLTPAGMCCAPHLQSVFGIHGFEARRGEHVACVNQAVQRTGGLHQLVARLVLGCGVVQRFSSVGDNVGDSKEGAQ